MQKIQTDLIIAAMLGIPAGGLAAFLLTPLLWDLEPVIHLELAGHSGPADGVIITIIFTTMLIIFMILRLFGKFKKKL